MQEYSIPIHDDPQPVSVRIPFRSTLKKLQTRWVGDLPGGVSGSVRLVGFDAGLITGSVTNQTGTDLKNIYFVFSYRSSERLRDKVIFVPNWKAGEALDLHKIYTDPKIKGIRDMANPLGNAADPHDHDTIQGWIDGPGGWERYWTHSWASGATGGEARGKSDFDDTVPRAFPMMSLFDRIAPAKNDPNSGGVRRVDFMRRGGRELDMSPAVEAGNLVILAQSASDTRHVPFPLSVNGSGVGGEGKVFYQYALPLDRTEMEKDAAR